MAQPVNNIYPVLENTFPGYTVISGAFDETITIEKHFLNQAISYNFNRMDLEYMREDISFFLSRIKHQLQEREKEMLFSYFQEHPEQLTPTRVIPQHTSFPYVSVNGPTAEFEENNLLNTAQEPRECPTIDFETKDDTESLNFDKSASRLKKVMSNLNRESSDED